MYVPPDSVMVTLLVSPSAATYAARNREAMLNGFSGCMYSMYQHHEHHIPVPARTPYDEKGNKFADKRYFVSYTNDRIAGQYLKEWAKHLTCDSLISNYPVDLAKGIAKRQINVWENFDELKKAGKSPETTLIVEAVKRLKVRSCLIDGEAVAVDDHGRRVFDDGFGLKSYTQSTFVW